MGSPLLKPCTPRFQGGDVSDCSDQVYLKSTWVTTSLRHPALRVLCCLIHLLLCFYLGVTSPLLTSPKTPFRFPVMPRRKSTPSKRQLVSPPGSVSKRPNRAGGWSEEDALRLDIPVNSTLSPSLTALCSGDDTKSVPQLQIDLTLLENDQVKLQVKGQEEADSDSFLSLAELFPDTYEAWKPHIATLAERGLLSLHINAKNEAEKNQWSFSIAVSVAWRKYMENCSSDSLGPMVAAPRANPMRAMHRMMIWLLKKTHDAQNQLAEVVVTCRFRYWKEIEVLYDRFVGNNTAAVAVVIEGLASESTSSNSEDPCQSEAISKVPSQPAPESLGSKLDALLARVEMLRQENPSVKCLLFSQWSQMLELVVQALRRVGVRCFMYGAKRHLPKLLAQFQACPAACVLAIPFKVGANGLNIVEATEVLLIEPLLSTSIEAQAVNRVHRLGQTRQTRVHRFIVQGSVEERIFRLGHKLKLDGAGEEQESKEETNDDDEGLQRLGVAPGRKEQEKLTMQDLQELLRGNSENAGGQLSQAATAVFWKELVMLNGNCVTRTAAYEFLERRHATQARVEGYDRIRGPQTTVFGKSVELLVGDELLALSYADGLSSVDVVEHIDPQLVHNQQEQIREQVRVWRNAQEDNAA
ncbi:hypothetical protein JG687_00008927 [Phytophthora cactorum]|uniref:Helicase C-terminal domain-containing protein n=1 Tax=Phytophthora cactorum TaxID=29920 RepID=A0A8T1UD42_9STRA|nr:hypothetical protein JG687_00008927 [Phytophthora cactorum]